MSRGSSQSEWVVDPARLTDVRIDCYVRSTVPAALAETVETTIERVQRLYELDRIAGVGINTWPPTHCGRGEASRPRSSCPGLVAEFEHWADQRGVSLEPAFRRRHVPSSLPGIEFTEPREQFQLPMVALALYDSRSDSLRGVVPYTENPGRDNERTRTVGEWLDAVESIEVEWVEDELYADAGETTNSPPFPEGEG